MDGDSKRAPISLEPAAGRDRLDALGVHDWPIYASGADDFEHRFAQDETCYVIEGEVTVTPRGGGASFVEGSVRNDAEKISRKSRKPQR